MKRKNETVFFLDENFLGQSFIEILKNAGVRVECLSDHFSRGTPDEEWLIEVGRKGWLVLTRDMAIGINIPEAIAVAQSNVRMFAFVIGNASREDIEENMAKTITKMENFAKSNPAPFIAKVYPDGKIRKWQHRNKLLKTWRKYAPDTPTVED